MIILLFLTSFKAYGIYGKLIADLESQDMQLTDGYATKSRMQCTYVWMMHIKSTIPQASVVYPILFVIFINNLPYAVKSMMKTVAYGII